MAARNPVSVGNLVPYEKRSIDRDSHRMAKASVYIPLQEVSSTVFGWTVILWIGWLFQFWMIFKTLYINITMSNNELTMHLLFLQYYLCIIIQSRLIYSYYSPPSLFWLMGSICLSYQLAVQFDNGCFYKFIIATFKFVILAPVSFVHDWQAIISVTSLCTINWKMKVKGTKR